MEIILLVFRAILSKSFIGCCLSLVFALGARRSCAAEPLWPAIEIQQVATGLSSPVDIKNAADGTDRLFVVQQTGEVRIVDNGVVVSTPFLNISSSVRCNPEQGLLSIAFPPGYTTKSYFYALYNRASDGAVVLSRFHLSADANVADSGSGEVLITIPYPSEERNGGNLMFGPDGYLYIARGDGGGEHADATGNAELLTNSLGKILRIDVEGAPSGVPYLIPASNPFAGDSSKDQKILLHGMRDPRRFTIDPSNGDLYVGDVGPNRQEISYVAGADLNEGSHLGWPLKEGTIDYKNYAGVTTGLISPLFEYVRTVGTRVSGGEIYRGSNPRMQGFYIFGDMNQRQIWAMKVDGGVGKTELLRQTNYRISAFGKDEDGELYFVDYDQGTLLRIDCLDQIPKPMFSPAPDVYTEQVEVSIINKLPGAKIHYTTDGSAPDVSSPVLAPGSLIEIEEPTGIKAIAIRGDMDPSDVLTGLFQLRPSKVEISGPSSLENDFTSATMSVSTPDSEIRYTLDGSDPTAVSTLYVPGSEIPLTKTTTIIARAFRAGWQPSVWESRSFVLTVSNPTLATPFHGLEDLVDLRCATAGATIRYTLDGSEPTADSPIWTGPQLIPAGTVIKTRSSKGDMNLGGDSLEVIRVIPQVIEVGARWDQVDAEDVAVLDPQSRIVIGGSYIWKVTDHATELLRSAMTPTLRSVAAAPGRELVFASNAMIYMAATPPYAELSAISGSATGSGSSFLPREIVILPDNDGYLVAQPGTHSIYKVTLSATTLFAGTGTKGHLNGPRLSAEFDTPVGLARATDGTLYVSERYSGRVRKIDVNGEVSDFAGTGAPGWGDGARQQARFDTINASTIDRIGNLYISEYKLSNSRIRKIQPDGTVTTLWNGGFFDPASRADFEGLDIDFNGVIYAAEANGVLKLVQEDWDNDGIPDETEQSLGVPYVVSIDDRLVDADDDGASNAQEWKDGTNPRKFQAISFQNIDKIEFTGKPLQLGAVASSLLPIRYVAIGPVTVKETQLIMKGLGKVTLIAFQDGNGIFDSAAPGMETFEIVDNVKPEVNLLKDTLSTRKPALRIAGAALDNYRLKTLEYRIKAPGRKFGRFLALPLGASTRRSFSIPVRLDKRGVYKVQIRVIDKRNNMSQTETVFVERL